MTNYKFNHVIAIRTKNNQYKASLFVSNLSDDDIGNDCLLNRESIEYAIEKLIKSSRKKQWDESILTTKETKDKLNFKLLRLLKKEYTAPVENKQNITFKNLAELVKFAMDNDAITIFGILKWGNKKYKDGIYTIDLDGINWKSAIDEQMPESKLHKYY